MKLASAFGPKCSGCGRRLPGATFHGGHDASWSCLGCPETLCAWCYGPHTEAKHPDMNVKGAT